MDVSYLLCLWVVRSFQSSICVVFLSYWRHLSEHVVLFGCLVLFCFSTLFCRGVMGVRDLFYCRIWWVWETCQTVSLFFWCPVLYGCPLFRYYMMGVGDLSCHVVLFPTLSPFCFSSFSVLASLLLFHRIVCNLVFEYIYIYTYIYIYIIYIITRSSEKGRHDITDLSHPSYSTV